EPLRLRRQSPECVRAAACVPSQPLSPAGRGQRAKDERGSARLQCPNRPIQARPVSLLVRLFGRCAKATLGHVVDLGGTMSATATELKNLVGGQWVEAVDGGTMDVTNPATGEVIASVPRGTAADVERAVEAAQRALPEWLDA